MAEKNGKDDFNIMSPNIEKVYIFHTSNAEKNHDYLIKH